jgi:hypothetical protein
MSIEKKSLKCVCGKFYSSAPSLCVHRKKCSLFLESKTTKQVNVITEGNANDNDDLSVSSAVSSSSLRSASINTTQLRLVELENKLKIKEMELENKNMEISNLKNEYFLKMQNKELEILNLKNEFTLKLKIKDLERNITEMKQNEFVINTEVKNSVIDNNFNVEVENEEVEIIEIDNNFNVEDENAAVENVEIINDNNIKLEIIEIDNNFNVEVENEEVENIEITKFDVKKSKIKIKGLAYAAKINDMKHIIENQKYYDYKEEKVFNNNTENNGEISTENNDDNKKQNKPNKKNEAPQLPADAMNFSDFVDKIDVSLTQFEMLECSGYVEGFSNTIIKELNDLEYDERPFQYDKKNKILYVKNENYEWIEDHNKKYLDLLIKKINKKYNSIIPEYMNTYKNVGHPSHSKNNQYLTIIQELMGGLLCKEAGVKYDANEINYNQDHKIISLILPNISLKK